MLIEADREQGPRPTLSQINPPQKDCASTDVEAKVGISDQDVRTGNKVKQRQQDLFPFDGISPFPHCFWTHCSSRKTMDANETETQKFHTGIYTTHGTSFLSA